MAKQHTISELQAKVKKGLEVARIFTTDPDLLKLLDDLERTWETLAGNLIIVSVGLSAMRYRTPEQIHDQLMAYQQMIQAGKLRAELFVTEQQNAYDN